MNNELSQIKVPKDYTMVAIARGQKVLFYQEFGSYQGDWLLLAHDDDKYYLYKDSYGSCSGCDSIQSEFDYSSEDLLASDPKVQNFIEDYKSFAEIPKEAAREFLRKGEIMDLFPRNMRGYDWDAETVYPQMALIIKSVEGMATSQEILGINNLETRRECIERMGEQEFMEGLGGEVIDTQGENKLVIVPRENDEPFVFVNVKDSSTPRRYMLRVPPETQTVQEGIAWTFEMPAEKYKPTMEA